MSTAFIVVRKNVYLLLLTAIFLFPAIGHAFEDLVIVEKIKLFGNVSWQAPSVSPNPGGNVVVSATNGKQYSFSITSAANYKMLRTFLNAFSSGREVIVAGVESCGCGCSYALTGVHLV